MTTPIETQTGPPNEAVNILNIGEDYPDEMASELAQGKSGLIGFYGSLNEKLQALTRIRLKEKVSFFQLLSIMIGAGVPLVKSLYTLANQLDNARMRKVVATMAQKVEGGKTLSSAMQDFHGIFDDSQIGMVHAAEASGKLNEILKDVASQAEKNAAVISKVKGAMIYPGVVITIMLGAVYVILAFVIPQIMELFTQTGTDLPLATQILIGLSDFVTQSSGLLFGGLAVVFGSIYLFKRSELGKYHWDNFLLHIPVIGVLIRNVCLARFTRTLSSLMNSGITIVKSLQIDADAVGNEIYRRRILLSAEDVSRGIPLAENLMDSRRLFPEMVVSMIAVGEQTAELATVSDKIADYYDEQVDQMSANMSKLMEPFIMVTMGVVVGGLVLAVMQPIFSLLDVVGEI